MQAKGDKICRTCGRAIQWRKKWERDWENVLYCSNRCRSKKVTPGDQALEAAILNLLKQRAKGDTICPSEAARAVGGNEWKNLMEPARQAARRLVNEGKIIITQKGRAVDPSTARGPIRLRLR